MSDPMNGYPFVISQDVIWRDMDAFQHVNNAVYFRYFEDVRQAMFKKLGMIAFMNSDHIGPILAHTRCDFRAPLTYPDRIHVGTCIKNVRHNRFTMKYRVYSEGLGRMAASGDGLVAYYDYGQEQSCDIPQPFVPGLQALQCPSVASP